MGVIENVQLKVGQLLCCRGERNAHKSNWVIERYGEKEALVLGSQYAPLAFRQDLDNTLFRVPDPEKSIAGYR